MASNEQDEIKRLRTEYARREKGGFSGAISRFLWDLEAEDWSKFQHSALLWQSCAAIAQKSLYLRQTCYSENANRF